MLLLSSLMLACRFLRASEKRPWEIVRMLAVPALRHVLDDLFRRLLRNRLAALRAMGSAYPGEQKPHIIVHFRLRTDGGSRV